MTSRINWIWRFNEQIFSLYRKSLTFRTNQIARLGLFFVYNAIALIYRRNNHRIFCAQGYFIFFHIIVVIFVSPRWCTSGWCADKKLSSRIHLSCIGSEYLSNFLRNNGVSGSREIIMHARHCTRWYSNGINVFIKEKKSFSPRDWKVHTELNEKATKFFLFFSLSLSPLIMCVHGHNNVDVGHYYFNNFIYPCREKLSLSSINWLHRVQEISLRARENEVPWRDLWIFCLLTAVREQCEISHKRVCFRFREIPHFAQSGKRKEK